jgi:flagellar protein FliO/FliZ
VLGVVWLLQRRVGRSAKKDRTREPVRVVAKRGIGAKAQLVVVEIDDVRYVLGVTDGGVSVIDRQPTEDAASARRSLAPVAPVTALPSAAPAATGSPVVGAATNPDADAEAPLPLRRTHATSRAAARAARSTSLSGFLQKDAAQVLRRALGA